LQVIIAFFDNLCVAGIADYLPSLFFQFLVTSNKAGWAVNSMVSTSYFSFPKVIDICV